MALDLGPQPITNRFLTHATDQEELFELRLGMCETCGTVQLLTLLSPKEIAPRFDWIAYIEPEGHLDVLADELIKLVDRSSSSVGVWTDKDISTLRRLEQRGLISGKDPVDLLLVRHVIEHVHDIDGFLADVEARVKPGGLLVFESPDTTRAFADLNYTALWEEHVFYFTPATFRGLFESRGFEIVWSRNFPYDIEGSLVLVVRKRKESAARKVSSASIDNAAVAYINGFHEKKKRTQAALKAVRAGGKKVVVFGAGHNSCIFINLNAVSGDIAFVLDENPKKQGLFMPGSRLPIKPPAALKDGGPYYCLMGVSPESQRKLNFGGPFASISSELRP